MQTDVCIDPYSILTGSTGADQFRAVGRGDDYRSVWLSRHAVLRAHILAASAAFTRSGVIGYWPHDTKSPATSSASITSAGKQYRLTPHPAEPPTKERRVRSPCCNCL